jgi:flagellar hook-associated protein 3 FlgL
MLRITSGIITDQLTRDLNNALNALTKQQRLIATGRRINEPADDPTGSARAMTIRAREAGNTQFQRNIDTARTRLAAGDASVRAIVDTLQLAQELSIQGANDTNDAEARRAIGTQIDQILEELVGLANGRGPDGTMLFGGQEITTAPYTVTRDVNGFITGLTVNPRGIDGTMTAEVSEGLTVVQGVSGNTVFGQLTDPTNAFDTLIRVRDALNINDGATVRTELDNVRTVHDRVNTAGQLAGTRIAWLDALESRLKDESVSNLGSLGEIEDADLTKAVSDMARIQTFYEGGLAAGAKLLQQSLIDFLR